MNLPFETTFADVRALTDAQLTSLLHRLLLLESERLGLPKRRTSVSLNIDIPDGGEDGRIEWEDGPNPEDSDWIPHRRTLFQVKATDMGPTKCRDEVLVTKKDGFTTLKPRVAEMVEQGGAYVLFYSRPCEGQHVSERIIKFREAFSEIAGAEKAEAIEIDVYGAEKISTWANQHAAAIAYVMSCLGRAIPADLQTWRTWQRDHQSLLAFHADEPRQELLVDLRNHLAEQGRVARLAALSGLGKSRLALEVFRPPEDPANDPELAALSAACIYVADGSGSADNIRQAMLRLRENNTKAVIVIDECPLDLHVNLEPIVTSRDSTLSLLTLDFDPASDPRSPACRFLKLEPFANEDVMALLRESHAQVPEEHLSKVAAFAQGFPRMAELLVRAILEDRTNLWELTPPTAIDKLIIRRSREPERLLRVAKALAILEHLGVDGIATHERELFAEHICGEDADNVYEVIKELEIAGIAYRRGDYVRLTPLPIAVSLAEQWWSHCDLDRAEHLLTSDLLTSSMVEATGNQLRRLSGNAWVQQLIERIYGPTGPFRRRDLLDSARGSRLTSSLAEAHPQVVCDALTHVFGSMTQEEARSVQDGRRDLVWCLEKLVWWPETFHDAAWLLLLFASGENEKWTNNATGLFLQLFHVLLSGTETPAAERLDVIKRGLQSDDRADLEPMIVKALGGALEAIHFSRTGGAEEQGGRFARKDWNPKTLDEVWAYWDEVLDMLNPYLRREDELGLEARAAIGNHARGMILRGGLTQVEKVAQGFIENGDEWPELLNGLRQALNYDGKEYPDDARLRVEQLIQQLEPKDLENRLRMIVSIPGWGELRKESDGQVTQVAEERALALARELAGDLESLLPLFPSLLRGEQRQGFNFGRELAVNCEDPLALLVKIVDAIQGVSEPERNVVVARGIAHSAFERKPDATGGFLRCLLEDPSSRMIAVDLLSSIGLNDEDVMLLSSLLEQKLLPSFAAQGLAYGKTLEQLQPETASRLVFACAEADDQGPVIALDLLNMMVYRRKLEDPLYGTVKNLLLRPGLLSLLDSTATVMDVYHFEVLAKAYLSQTGDEEFAALLMDPLANSISGDHGYTVRQVSESLIAHLVKNFRDVVWPVLQAYFVDAGSIFRFRMEHILEDLDVAIVFGDERLLAWCEEDEKARHWVARIANPLQEKNTDAQFPSWTPFATALLDRYGSDPDLLSSMASSIYSGSWTGSAVPRLTRHREAYSELLIHKNPDVGRWARDAIDWLAANIETERKRDEERDFGIYH